MGVYRQRPKAQGLLTKFCTGTSIGYWEWEWYLEMHLYFGNTYTWLALVAQIASVLCPWGPLPIWLFFIWTSFPFCFSTWSHKFSGWHRGWSKQTGMEKEYWKLLKHHWRQLVTVARWGIEMASFGTVRTCQKGSLFLCHLKSCLCPG